MLSMLRLALQISPSLAQGGKGERGLPGTFGSKGEKGERVSDWDGDLALFGLPDVGAGG